MFLIYNCYSLPSKLKPKNEPKEELEKDSVVVKEEPKEEENFGISENLSIHKPQNNNFVFNPFSRAHLLARLAQNGQQMQFNKYKKKTL